MALIKCPDCGKDVSDKAANCSNCGYPIAKQINSKEDSETSRHQTIAWLVFFGIIFSAIALNLFLDGESKKGSSGFTKDDSISTKWYQGGTLHTVSIREYWSATESNRLATCADFATHTLKGKVNSANWEDLVLERATAIKACIETATKGLSQTQDLKVAEVAAMCTVNLGY